MSIDKKHKTTIRPIVALGMLVAMMVLGFCPLRNTVSTLLFHPGHTVPKTDGSHLLNADDACRVQYTQPGVNAQQNTILPPLAFAVLSLFWNTNAISADTINIANVNAPVDASITLPLYLRHRVWRI